MATFKRSKEISRREQFGDLLNNRGLTGVAVEVGTHRAEFATALLATWIGQKLFCVDPWITNMKDYVDVVNDHRNRDVDYDVAVAALSQYGPRAEVVRMLSTEAVLAFNDASLDFSHLDANHQYRYVTEDIEIWWPKIKPGGIFAGHDINGYWEHQVKPAVSEFADREGLTVFTVPGDAASWYVIKPEAS